MSLVESPCLCVCLFICCLIRFWLVSSFWHWCYLHQWYKSSKLAQKPFAALVFVSGQRKPKNNTWLQWHNLLELLLQLVQAGNSLSASGANLQITLEFLEFTSWLFAVSVSENIHTDLTCLYVKLHSASLPLEIQPLRHNTLAVHLSFRRN